MRLGILGGSFNPVHNGHLYLAEQALSAFNLDRIAIIPAYRSPFKLDASGMESSANDRLDMLAAAFTGDSRFAIDDCEIKRGGVSYTADTLEDIVLRYMPKEKPLLIIGDDLAKDIVNWHNSEKIFKLADIVIGRRVGGKKENYPFAHKIMDNEIMNISSNTIRARIGKNESWQSLVPTAVRAIIEDRKLYGFKEIIPGIVSTQEIITIETAVRETLSTVRFLHSRNTALLAYDLCCRFALDPKAGYLAGIAHDFAKELDSKQMIKLVKSANFPVNELEKKKPNLLHGKAAAVLLKERFCINNKDILEAVAVHTSGTENMGPLAKIIYIADKAEVSRNIDSEMRRICKEEKLDNILVAVIKRMIIKLKLKDAELSEDTLRLLKRMEKKL